MVASTRPVRETTITTTAESGILDTCRETQFKLLVRKVDLRTNPRGGTATEFKSSVGDDFGVTKARVVQGS